MAAISLDTRLASPSDAVAAGPAARGEVVVVASDRALGSFLFDALEVDGWRVRPVGGLARLTVGLGSPGATPARPAVAILQVDRSDGPAGRAALRYLRAACGRNLPVLTVGTPLAPAAAGFDAHLDHPFELDDLLDTVRRITTGAARRATPVP